MSDEAASAQASRPLTVINPPELGTPRGFAHGMLGPPGGRLLFVAGQTAAGADGSVAAEGFAEQFEIALARVLTVLSAAGGRPEHVARMTMYVTSMEEYRASRPTLRGIWNRHMGAHYPAMAVVEVTGLVDAGAGVEIEADAVLP